MLDKFHTAERSIEVYSSLCPPVLIKPIAPFLPQG